MAAFQTLLGLGSQHTGPTYRGLVERPGSAKVRRLRVKSHNPRRIYVFSGGAARAGAAHRPSAAAAAR